MTYSDGGCFTAWLGFAEDLAIAPDGTTVVSLHAMGDLLGDSFADLSGPALLLKGRTGRTVTRLDELPLALEFSEQGDLVAAFADSVGYTDMDSGTITTVSKGGFLSGLTVRDLALGPIPSIPEPCGALLFAAGTVLVPGLSRSGPG